MNKVFTEILKNKDTAIQFISWYKDKYGNEKLSWFTNAEFIEQIGYFILYFEEKHNMHINCAENGYIVFYAKPALAQTEMRARIESGKDYFIHREEYTVSECVKSIFITYERAIIRIFEELNLPF